MPSPASAEVQALTSRLRARAPLLDWNQTCLHIRVINGVDHTREHDFSRLLQPTRTGHSDARHADAVVNSDAGAPKVPHDGSPGAQADRVRDDRRVVLSGGRLRVVLSGGADQDGAL